MANIKSQIKRNKQADEARWRNRQVRSTLKTLSRHFRKAVEAEDKEEATKLYRAAARAYDKAATKGVVHRNTAANKKSGMAKQLQQL
jgi:small subunit ribosomal protein S20